MSQIYDFTSPFHFEKLSLGTPASRNGSYFMKLAVSDEPIYLQLPKSSMKQGLLKVGKKHIAI